MLGLTKLISPDALPEKVQPMMANVMKLLCFLSQRSVEIRIATDAKREREE